MVDQADTEGQEQKKNTDPGPEFPGLEAFNVLPSFSIPPRARVIYVFVYISTREQLHA